MKMNMIEVDDIVMEYLKKNAEPFSDTPNSVLHKLLFGTRNNNISSFITTSSNPRIPRALSHTMDVIHEVIKNGLTRQDATRIVAERNGTATQTIIDKYCRQLGKTASEVDHLLQEPGLESLQTILKNKFSRHEDTISHFFSKLSDEKTKQSFSSQESLLPRTQIGKLEDGTLADLCVKLVEQLLQKGYLKPSQVPIFIFFRQGGKVFYFRCPLCQ